MYRVMPIFEKNARVTDLVITCADYRLQQGLQQLISQHLQLAGRTDVFQYPGSSLQFVLNRQMIIQNIQLFRDLHGIETVILIDHMLCGTVHSHLLKTHRCKDQTDIANTEHEIHTEYLRYAYCVIKEELPGVAVKLFLYNEDGLIQEIEPAASRVIVLDQF